MKQRGNTMKKIVQKFRRTTRKSKYEERPLIEEFMKEMNKMIRRKLMEAEQSSWSIEQQYERATNLDRYQRESRGEEERLRKRREIEAQAPRTNILANFGKT